MQENGNLTTLIAKLISKEKRYCVFLGAGFSKDAGIKTGWEILLDTLKPIYVTESEKIESEITDFEVEKWYNNHKIYRGMTYSKILEINHQTQLERKVYLNRFFENAQPGESHRLLAELIQLGYFKFVFTTNFDDLLEKALTELNIDFDLITSENDIIVNESWDKTKTCRIFKLHGDYKRSNLKNTEIELKNLDKLMGEDFQYIIDRHGIVFIGYSGRDEGIMNQLILRKKCQYPIYWQYVTSNPNSKEFELFHQFKFDFEQNAPEELIFIQNNSAATFLKEVKNGIEKLERYLNVSKESIESYKDIIIYSNSKQLNAFTFDLIDNFEEIFVSYLKKEHQLRGYNERFELLLELLHKISFVSKYLETLLKYNFEDNKLFRIFTEKILNILLIYRKNSDDFICNDVIYYLVLSFISLFLKFKKFDAIYSILFYTIKSPNSIALSMVEYISRSGRGWLSIDEKNVHNYINFRFEILSNNLPENITRDSFFIADTYFTLYIILIQSNKYNWYNNSGLYGNYFIDVFEEYFNSENVYNNKDLLLEYKSKLKDYFIKIPSIANSYVGISLLIERLNQYIDRLK